MSLTLSLSEVNARQSTRLFELFILPFCEPIRLGCSASGAALGRRSRAWLGMEWRNCRQFHKLDRDLIKSGVACINLHPFRLESFVQLTPAGRELAGQVMARDWADAYHRYLKLSGDKAAEGFVYS